MQSPGKIILLLLLTLFLHNNINAAVDTASDFILKLESEKSDVYVGEPFKVTMVFKKRHNHDAVDFKLVPPQTPHFWIKDESQGRQFEEKGFTISRQVYIIAAQQAGSQHIGSAQMKVATRKYARDAWGQWMPGLRWESYFSNSLDIAVIALPKDVLLVGDFTMTAQADTQDIEANEAVNVTVTVSGSGNFEDIGSMKPVISGVSVFDEEGVTKAFVEQGRYRGAWHQKLAFISRHDFIIPPMILHYFDPKSKTIKKLETESIPVHVRNTSPLKAKNLIIERGRSQEESTEQEEFFHTVDWKVSSFIGVLVGLFFGIMLMLLPWKEWMQRQKSNRSVALNDSKAVLALLLQHLDDAEAEAMAILIEGNLFEGKNTSVDKKSLKALLKRLQVD